MGDYKKLLPPLLLSVLLGALDLGLAGPVIPAISEHFSLTSSESSWFFSAFVIGTLVSATIMSKIADTAGRSKIMQIELLIIALGAVITIFAPEKYTLFAGRFIAGFGAGGVFPIASAVVGSAFPREKQGLALGMISSVFALSYLIGPVIAGFIIPFGWQYIYLIYPLFVPVAIFLAYKFIPNDKSTIFRPALDIFDFFTKKTYLLIFLATFVAGFAQSFLVFLPTLAIENFSLDNSAASFFIVPVVVAMFIAAPSAGRLTDIIGPRKVIAIAGLLLISGLLVLAFFSDEQWGFQAGGILAGVATTTLLGPPFRYILNSVTSVNKMASGQGLINIMIGIGQMAGAYLAGTLIEFENGFFTKYLIFAGLSMLIVFTAAIIRYSANSGSSEKIL
jgi:MFS family permease